MTAPLRLGLVGGGIQHSLSPRLHAAALAQSGIFGNYTLFDCQDDHDARAVFARLRDGELDGLNVTTPFKALALQSADAWMRTAHHRAGVFTHPANTLFMQDNRLVAASTDGHGLGAALLSANLDLVGKRVVLLGAGGAGHAVAAELLALGAAQLRIGNRSPAAATALVHQLNTIWPGRAVAQPWGDAHGLAGVDVVVHATRLGHGLRATPETIAQVHGELGWLPWTTWSAHPPALADLVYADDLTPFQGLAVQHGLPCDARLAEAPIVEARIHKQRREPHGIVQFFGQAMLAHQAARSFALWTGARVDGAQLLTAILPQTP